jgi:hypothetical protein
MPREANLPVNPRHPGIGRVALRLLEVSRFDDGMSHRLVQSRRETPLAFPASTLI